MWYYDRACYLGGVVEGSAYTGGEREVLPLRIGTRMFMAIGMGNREWDDAVFQFGLGLVQ